MLRKLPFASFVIASSWLLMTLNPPWHTVVIEQGRITAEPGTVYGPLWAPPDPQRLKIAFLEGSGDWMYSCIDYGALFTQFALISLLLGVALVFFKSNIYLEAQKKLFVCLASICVVTSIGLLGWQLKIENEPKNAPVHEHAKTDVIYAMREIPSGTIIAPDALEVHKIDSRLVPESALTDMKSVVGRKACKKIALQAIVGRNDIAAVDK